ncbi:type II secretion system secretin GspD [Luteimonas sp. Y-2-2-4F]|nr:type II secretion system secretin GspD [Luteimonas sp. Y-2-2-4F]MCD9030526.1 type II secretion system secretin GspD [Luteimonas sp. Y-2-2-4F]
MTRTSRASFLNALAIGLLATLLAACATAPMPDIRRDGAAVPRAAAVESEPLEEDDAGPRAQIRRGTQQTINRSVAASAPPNLAGTSGEATFNFEGESVHAVVKAVLGDMLGQNYVIAPEVQGTVTLATPRPVSPAQALSLLEMVLGWNNARMIYSDGRYNIVPADGALATGAVAPRTGGATTARGFEARTVQLRYISATEMEKVLEPYARPNAIVNVDNARNVITVAGTRGELENYLRTIEIFDVDWLAGMSVGVFPLESGRASQVVGDLEKVFGEESNSPVAGMFRFLPLEGANAVMVITAQPSYLDEIQRWLERIDGAGGESRLFSYELKYIKAAELAERLAQVFGAGGGRRGGEGGSASLMPGTNAMGLGGQNLDERRDGSSLTGSDGTTGGGGFEGQLSLGPQQQGATSVTLEVDGTQVGVSAVDETNTLLVRATASAWKSIREVVERLDVMPMQVHIEAQVAEVALNGELRYGVNWFFERAVTDAGLPDAFRRTTWSSIAGNVSGTTQGGVSPGLGWTFLGRNAAAVISALDEITDLRLLQTPSVFVRNNAEATLNVGSRIPISSVSVNPIFGAGDNAISQVQYIDTGIILKVRPRVTRDGMVFLDIVQEVSSPGDVADDNGNVRINTRRMKTEAAVQAGDTVMLAGLISDQNERGSTGFPGLSRLPVIGGLFGQQRTRNERTEVIILLTPTIVRDPLEARRLTDEYSRRFQALEPLRQQEARDAERRRRQAEREAAEAARRGEPAGVETDGVE